MQLDSYLSNSKTTLIWLFGFWAKVLKRSVYDYWTSVSNFQLRFIYRPSPPYNFSWGQYLLGRPLSRNCTFLLWGNLIYFYNSQVIYLVADYLLAISQLNFCYDSTFFKCIICARVTNFSCVFIKTFIQWVVLIEMSISLTKHFPILILESLQKEGLNQMAFPFLCLFF